MSRYMQSEGDMIVVADAHLGRDDVEVDVFCDFLDGCLGNAAVVVLLGDIFSLWLGLERFCEEHHLRVLEACRRLHLAGTRVEFVEGNREFSVRKAWQGRAFDRVEDRHMAVEWAGKRWLLAHGDLIHPGDRPYRVFRKVVRSRLVQAVVGCLSPKRARGLASRIERDLRSRNLSQKTKIPPSRFDAYLQRLVRGGFDGGVIGHIHVEHHVETPDAEGRKASLYVVPDWRSTHRYLCMPPDGEPHFVAWRGAPEPAPAVVEVEEVGEEANVVFDREPIVESGAWIRIDSGHGFDVARRGRVVARGRTRTALRIRLEPGMPIQVGDRMAPAENQRGNTADQESSRGGGA